MSQHHTAPHTTTDQDDAQAPDLIWHTPPTRRWLIRDAYGTPSMAATVALATVSLFVLIVLAIAVGPHLLHALQWIAQPAHSTVPAGRLWHTVNDPIYYYLQTHSAGLPAGPRTLFTFWGLAGAVILLLALRQGATVGVQLGAALFGALSVAMVWQGTEGPGKPVAAGLAALAWGVLAALALTGSWITTHTTVINEPPAPAPAAPAPVVPVTVEVPAPRIEAVVVDVQTLQVDINGRRLTGDDDQDH
ncbi:hypothetical protein OG689_44195 [Kitasatospora sp. NBC_00240]|uniref:hypothetical protein n=1 Tax=Kitasatospora sp. NBC_00240 TaxID=2903567 RepID=UPI00224FB319|nr:hypothetical protein [Kitasatospora sp. NBC_00240]MCX5216139.1 hypothetical protein [Kitasatospora sp. NBC_00240]